MATLRTVLQCPESPNKKGLKIDRRFSRRLRTPLVLAHVRLYHWERARPVMSRAREKVSKRAFRVHCSSSSLVHAPGEDELVSVFTRVWCRRKGYKMCSRQVQLFGADLQLILPEILLRGKT